MGRYQKIALVVIRVHAYIALLAALRTLFGVTLYISAMYLRLVPRFYVNAGADAYWGFLEFFLGLLILGISNPLALLIGGRLDQPSAETPAQ
jgi:hypothetical protein